MTEILLIKNFGKLEAADPIAEEYLKGISIGEMVKAKVTKPRNGKFHRKFYSLLKLGYDNQEAFTNFDHFRKAVTIEAGFYEDRRMYDGSMMREAKSISFAALDELEFARLYNATVSVIADFLGTEDTYLAQEVQNYLTVGAG